MVVGTPERIFAGAVAAVEIMAYYELKTVNSQPEQGAYRGICTS